MAARSDMPRCLAAGVGVNGTKDEKRDWSQLLPEIVREIADEMLLPVDVTEYIRLRAVCKLWRGSTTDPRLLHPRFFPHNWLMLKARNESEDEDDEDKVDAVTEEVEAPPAKKMKELPAVKTEAALPVEEAGRRFVNVRTGDMLRIRLPPVEEYGYVLTTVTGEGLLVLLCERTNTVRIFNPLTMTMTVLPGLARAPRPVDYLVFTSAGVVFDGESPERPTVVLIVAGMRSAVILYAKPGDDNWGIVDAGVIDDNGNRDGRMPPPPPFNRGLSLHGRFYVATRQGDVLEVALAPRPHLVYVVRPPNDPRCTCGMAAITCYLVPSLDDAGDNDGMLLVRCDRFTVVDVYGVHVGNGSYTLLTMLGNRAIFLPSRTLRADKFPLLPQGTVNQPYEDIEDYIGKPTSE